MEQKEANEVKTETGFTREDVMKDNEKRRKFKRCGKCGYRVKSERHEDGSHHKGAPRSAR